MNRVAVIGAGMAGLSCAAGLADRGIEVAVFDKGRGAGGRISTRRAADLAFDHGAQYFTVRDPVFAQQVERWESQGFVARWEGRIVRIGEGGVTDTSPHPRFVGVPGMSAIGSALAKRLPVQLQTRISRVRQENGVWEIVDERDQLHGPFDAIVVAVPAPQASDLLKDHPFATAIARTTMTPCWAVLAAFPVRVEVDWDGAFIDGGALSWVARNNSKPGRNLPSDCWTLHASPGWSAEHLERTPEEIAPLLLAAFFEAAGAAPSPTHFLQAHRWRFSQGSSSGDEKVLFDGGSRLAVCGDWLGGGRIEGAFLSGVAAAQALLDGCR
jgi:predicted NAD/FAD-dependent oxidoreductase